jgi:uncharacterized protein YpmS
MYIYIYICIYKNNEIPLFVRAYSNRSLIGIHLKYMKLTAATVVIIRKERKKCNSKLNTVMERKGVL